MHRRGLHFVLATSLVALLTSYLSGPVAAATPHAWAFGEYYDGSQQQMLIEQWNGINWAVQTNPTVAGAHSEDLAGAVATSATNVWAVGSYYDGVLTHSLIVRGNGTTWSQQAAPQQGAYSQSLSAVAATSTSSAWAVGYYLDASHNDHTLILHWNGSNWSIQPSPDKGTLYSDLTSVTAISDTNVWAFGFYGTAARDGNLALHWNGTKWSVQTLPNKGTHDNDLWAADSSSAQDVWSAGSVYNRTTGNRQTIALHRTSSGWHVVSTPNVSTTDDGLHGIASITPTNAWAVGWYNTPSTGGIHLVHWNGSSWATRSVPAAIATPSRGRAIFALSASNIWAVGNYNGSGHAQTLVLHYNGTKWKVQASDNASTFDEALAAITAVP